MEKASEDAQLAVLACPILPILLRMGVPAALAPPSVLNDFVLSSDW
jgi:hypothetical protein